MYVQDKVIKPVSYKMTGICIGYLSLDRPDYRVRRLIPGGCTSVLLMTGLFCVYRHQAVPGSRAQVQGSLYPGSSCRFSGLQVG